MIENRRAFAAAHEAVWHIAGVVTRQRQQMGDIDEAVLRERIRALSEALMETEV